MEEACGKYDTAVGTFGVPSLAHGTTAVIAGIRNVLAVMMQPPSVYDSMSSTQINNDGQASPRFTKKTYI